ncbi:16S rRNA m(7)G-527 methyltransferase [Halopolyspora algeriensis]|uniref:Ribosomal RNA small subunit methyltransferase G n=1 Tax=Halopolyspora algeriensis TaxID=1500506 RepID=A0A368VYE3_9ACTN|nr:16S rRNA (guanine(527)-N(7))-methyltransferase RsmG [Halopolyspora algeriensis]RCW47228.1 16S rRNA m(7)G-527 methyltransferase [Halopolyspora algeriensis]TQM48313.1 16S rRNA m(7)G-527 methyltransferase [Halopolyspora algeriensis]
MEDREGQGSAEVTQEAKQRVFGERLPLAEHFARMLTEHGVRRGLIGPREVGRLWERHLLNSAVIAELLTPRSGVLDVGSGAGLPGIPLAIARPDITVTLLEPMARRVAWLQEVVAELALTVEVVRGRAEEGPVRERLAGQDVVIARAVAPMERLTAWCLPLARPGGRLLAMKGASASEELARDRVAIERAGGARQEVLSCGGGVLEVPTNVVVVERAVDVSSRPVSTRRRSGKRRTRKDR